MDLNTIDVATSGAIDAATLTTLTGTASAVSMALTSSGITGLGNEAVTLSDTTLAAAALNTLDGQTSGVVNAATVTTLTGTIAAVTTAYGSSGISGLGNEAVTLSDTTATAASLNTLDGLTSGTIDAGTVATLTGTALEVATAVASSGITFSGTEAVTLSGTTAAAADLNTIDAATSGAINAAALTTLTGSAAAVAAAYASSGITGLANETVTLSGTTAAAADLNAIDAATSGAIDAATVTTLTGTAAAVSAAIGSSGITGLGNEAVTLSDTTLAAASLNTLNGLTTGVVDAALVTTLTGAASAVSASYTANTAGTISGLGDEAVTLNDTTLAATALNTLNGQTTGVVNAASVTTLTGAISDVAASYAANTATTISGLGNEAVTLNDTTAAATDLTALDGLTSGTVNAGTVATVSGTAAQVDALATAIGAGGITVTNFSTTPTGALTVTQANNIDLRNGTGEITATISNGDAATLATLTGNHAYTITITDATVAATHLAAIGGATSIAVNAAAITTLTGLAAQVSAVYAAQGAGFVTGLGNENVTLADTSVAATALTSLDLLTTGTVNAGTVTTVTGTAGEVDALATAIGLGGTTVINFATTPVGTLTVTQANNIDLRNGNGQITATISGNAAGTLATLTGEHAYTITVTGAATAAQLLAINAATSVTVIATGVTQITGSAADVLAAISATGITFADDVDVLITGTEAEATDLTGIDALTDGEVDARSITTVTGTPAELQALSDAIDAETILAGDFEFVVGALTVAEANDIDAGNGAGEINATITDQDVTTLKTLTGEHAYTITIADLTATAADLLVVDSKTSLEITATAVTAVSGSVTDVNALLASQAADGINLSNAAYTVTGTAGADTFNGGTKNEPYGRLGSADTFNVTGGTDTITDLGAAAPTSWWSRTVRRSTRRLAATGRRRRSRRTRARRASMRRATTSAWRRPRERMAGR